MGGACNTHGREEKYKLLIRKPERKSPFGRLWCRWEDNSRMELREIGQEGVDWFHLA
jgi:hypothetical protein